MKIRTLLLIACLIGVQAVAQAVEDTPVDKTSLIVNPSFETNGTAGWTVNNMQTQTNTVFQKSGTTYLESWVARGQQIGNASVCQTLMALPKGNYQLKATALHIQQTGSGSTTNTGSLQTGACLFAGTAQTTITGMRIYSLDFSVLDETSNIEIGMKAEDATGNYLCVDNFILQYMGAIDIQSYVDELTRLVSQGKALLDKNMQTAVKDTLTTALTQAGTALQPSAVSGSPAYNETALTAAYTALKNAIADANTSIALYEALQTRIDYAEQVVGWWNDNERKATLVANLSTAIDTAKVRVADFSLTTTQLKNATSALNTRIAAVDKRIYCSTNACGTDAQLKNSASQWCYDRSLQSKHWVLFWEAGYGQTAPAVVPGILETADRIFEFYADSLKYITINEGKSKTDTYKMIIRLRFTTTWEASGSGIDNQIGLLTLSNGAHTSRDGQTVAHEIGHCFQYQVHCDNNNQNGWMYNWGQSTLNVFWEMCAQWQAYKFYPAMQFNNEWLTNTLNGLHRHPLCVNLRYNNYFIQDYFCHKHGMDFLGRMWNESKNPEDPFQAYMRLTMTGPGTQKLAQLNDEMWEYGARMTTFDMDPIRSYGKSTIGKRKQTTLTDAGNGFWSPTKDNCIENFGNNAIRLNPTKGKTVYAELVGQAGKAGYTTYNKVRAGWRLGFVAMENNGTRHYGEIGSANYNDSTCTVAFESPANCTHLWLVVSGAPTSYWTRDWLSWEGESTAEQWPYRVKFYYTNVMGKPNNNTDPTGIDRMTMSSDRKTAHRIFTLTGQLVRSGSTSLEGLPQGIYIVNGKKVQVK